ncbi:hypothetical protein DITRI_Ditri15bG0140600 [Diplodiscus trichospermus]
MLEQSSFIDNNFLPQCVIVFSFVTILIFRQLEHTVFVHYKEVKEGYKSEITRLLVDPGSHIESLQIGPGIIRIHVLLSILRPVPYHVPLQWSLKLPIRIRKVSSWFTEFNSNHCVESCFSLDIHHLVTNTISMPVQKLYCERPIALDFETYKEAHMRQHDVSDVVTFGDKLIGDVIV